MLSPIQSTRKPYTFELFSSVDDILLQDPSSGASKYFRWFMLSTGTWNAFFELIFYVSTILHFWRTNCWQLRSCDQPNSPWLTNSQLKLNSLMNFNCLDAGSTGIKNQSGLLRYCLNLTIIFARLPCELFWFSIRLPFHCSEMTLYIAMFYLKYTNW